MEPVSKKDIPVFASLIPVFFLVISLGCVIVIYNQSPHIPLIMATAVSSLVALKYGFKWREIQNGMVHGVTLALDAVIILMVIGTMIGAWIEGGIVPAMIFYGLKILSPSIFLPATLIICSIVALGTGSSWATAGTVGVALIGVGKGLDIPVPMVAGAIISGAYFGDKMSPLSDTTNLAPAVSGTDIFTHIRHMVYTTTPAYLISLILYSIIGYTSGSGDISSDKIDTIVSTLGKNFNINIFLLIPPLLVIVMVVKKIPALPALLGGTLLGAAAAFIFQSSSAGEVIGAMQSGYTSETGVQMVDNLLTRGGLMNMMETVALIICALTMGGVMEKTGMLKTLAAALLKRVKRTGTLITATVGSGLVMDAIAPDQYLAIVIPGRMYRKAYEERRLHPKNLSRCLEDSATLFAPLIPWNTCGAFMMATLGISPLIYLPYAFLNLLTPLISIFYGYTGITIEKLPEEKNEVA